MNFQNLEELRWKRKCPGHPWHNHGTLAPYPTVKSPDQPPAQLRRIAQGWLHAQPLGWSRWPPEHAMLALWQVAGSSHSASFGNQASLAGASHHPQWVWLGMAWAPHPFLFGQSIWQLLLPSGQWTTHRAGGVRRPRRMTPWSLSDHPEGDFGACIKIVQQTARPKPKACTLCTSRKNVCCWPCALLRKDQPYIDLPRLWLVNCWSTVARKHAGVAVSGDENDQNNCVMCTPTSTGFSHWG